MDETSSQISQIREELGTLAGSVKSLLAMSKERWERDDKEKGLLWEGIKELANKGQISISTIATVLGMILSISSAAATLAYLLMQSQVEQLKITDRDTAALLDAEAKSHERVDGLIRQVTDEKIKQLEIRTSLLHEQERENHAAIRELEKQAHLSLVAD